MSRKKKDRTKPRMVEHNTPTNYLDEFDCRDAREVIGDMHYEIEKYSHLPNFSVRFEIERGFYDNDLDGIWLKVRYTETPEMVDERIRQEDAMEAERAEMQRQADIRAIKNNIPKTKAGKIAMLKRLKSELGLGKE
jgi:hypothetical protein